MTLIATNSHLMEYPRRNSDAFSRRKPNVSTALKLKASMHIFKLSLVAYSIITEHSPCFSKSFRLSFQVWPQPRTHGLLPTHGAAVKSLVQAGHVTPRLAFNLSRAFIMIRPINYWFSYVIVFYMYNVYLLLFNCILILYGPHRCFILVIVFVTAT